MTSRLLFLWAVGGVAAVLAWATVRLGAYGLATVQAGLTPWQWVVLALLVGAFAYGEGVLALERRWAPRVVGRARTLAARPVQSLHLVAPLHAMGLVAADARTLVRSWLGVASVAVAVLVVRRLPDPWRGMIDLAVALALVWGVWGLLRRTPVRDTGAV